MSVNFMASQSEVDHVWEDLEYRVGVWQSSLIK